ncbi:hypothetical protein [uncultured Jatrophihabitans sp.]|uniref:hypothetical protein n=1 Tax=uncultured Jatrophihabitans sp. TaxID=1610747 RepID=UPI0035C95B9E
MDYAVELPVSSVAQALEMVPDVPFLLVTIDSPAGERRRTDAVVLRPRSANSVFGPEVGAGYGDLPQIALLWFETLEPMYAGHPGSVWPIETARRESDSCVTFSGPAGTATLRAPDLNFAARLGGWADVLHEATLPADADLHQLPVNRKERFYTGTVLPTIVTGNGFADLNRLMELCGLTDIDLDDLDVVQFFTEYSFAESVYTDADKARFAHRPKNADTPDVVLRGPGWLLAIEAKMFHRPNAASLNAQYRRQSVLVDYWAARLGANPVAVRHVLLLPQALAAETGPGLQAPVITWESLLVAYRNTAPAYWLKVLREALHRYPELASKDSLWGQNAEQKLAGAEIVAASEAGDQSVAWVGRSGGVNGKLLAADIASGEWKTKAYEVSSALPAGKATNWFPVAEFISRVMGAK